MRFFTASQTHQAEENAIRMGLSWLRLMENAGSAASRVIREKFEVQNRRIVVVCGRGNNGGDGYVVARKLKESGASVQIVQSNGGPLTPNALEMYSRVVDFNIPVVDFGVARDEAILLLKNAELIVDAIFGTGFHGKAEPPVGTLIQYLSAVPAKVVSLDLPSGAACDTGAVEGECVKADLTVSFTVYKPCHVLYPAADFCGEISVASIGISPEALDPIASSLQSIDCAEIQRLLPPRRKNTNKGDFGKALLVCGSFGMAGAAALAALAAVRSGAGLTRVAVPESVAAPLAAKFNEPVLCPLDETADGTLSLAAAPKIRQLVQKSTAVLAGCGLGAGMDVEALIKIILEYAACPVVLDADGINALSGRIDIIKQAKVPLILTPHPGEMARLLGTSIEEVESARVECASGFARENGVVLVLKGAHTIVAVPGEEIYVNLTGNPGMAKGGSGDMLAGMIVSFLAQGLDAGDAAKAGVYLHGLAGDRAAAKLSQRGMIPTDMISELPALFHEIEAAG